MEGTKQENDILYSGSIFPGGFFYLCRCKRRLGLLDGTHNFLQSLVSDLVEHRPLGQVISQGQVAREGLGKGLKILHQLFHETQVVSIRAILFE